VISVQTALVHLAGALGQKVWALIPAAPEWRYGAQGESMPWYASVRLMRQTRPNDWSDVIERVAAQIGPADCHVTKNVS
jgi:ADP-heptose:LPS heptosyltransferase